MIKVPNVRGTKALLTASIWFAGLAAAAACDGNGPGREGAELLETRIAGVALMNTSGARVEATSFQDGSSVGRPTVTDAMGRYDLALHSASGDLVVKVCGGSYVDMVTGAHTDVGDACLHALVSGVEVCEQRQAHVGPFSELVYSYAYAKGLVGAETLRSHLERWMGDDVATTRSAVFSEPKASEGEDTRGLNPRSMSYLVLGGLSRLAQDLSDRIGLSVGSRVSTMRLVQLLSQDISDGSIDGYDGFGTRLMLAERHVLPPQLLRQDLAQAIGRFAKSDRNRSGVGYEAIVDFLSNVSADTLPALGPNGVSFDRDPPSLTLTGILEGATVTSNISLGCRAHDATGVREMKLEVRSLDRDEVVGGNHYHPAHGGHQREETFFEFDVSGLRSGRYRFTCWAEDVWGHGQERSSLFSINQGDVTPEVLLDPPLRGPDDLVRGSRAIQCGFDDPYVVEIQAIVEGPTQRAELPRVAGRRAASYQWDSSVDMDGPHTISCLAWTTGHREPRMTSMQVRVANHPRGLASGRLFLGAPLSSMEVSAFKWDRSGRGDRIGGPVVVGEDDGSFEVSLSNEYRGPVLLEARFVPSTDPPSMASMVFRDHRQEVARNMVLALLVDGYDPGQRLESLSINAATTLATDLATAEVRSGVRVSLQRTIQEAFYTFERHVSPRSRFDSASTQVPDMTRALRGMSESRIALGLFHAGLAAMAADECAEGNHNRDASTMADVLASLRDDIMSGELNGRDQRGRTVRTPFSDGGPDMLRYRLARSVYSWLRMTEGSEPMLNRTGLGTEDVILSGWLQSISTSDSPLFGGAPATPFDADGPVITLACRARDGTRVDCSQTFRDGVNLRVTSSDIIGVERTDVFHRGSHVRPSEGSTPEEADYYIGVEDGFHGESLVSVRSRDRMGNVSEEEMRFTFDRRPVELSGLRNEYYAREPGEFFVPVTSTADVVKIQIHGEKRARDGREIETYTVDVTPSRAFNIPVRLPPEDGPYRFHVATEDVLGNTGRVDVNVLLESRPIQIGFANPQVWDRETIPARKVAFGSVAHMTFYDVDLDSCRWRHDAVGSPKWWFWSTRDEKVEGDDPRDPIRAWYRYSMSDRGLRRQGSWRELPSNPRPGIIQAFAVEMSYRAMLESLYDTPANQLGPEENIVFHATHQAEHILQVRVADPAGNSAETEWKFGLKIVPPPLEIRLVRHNPERESIWREFVRSAVSRTGESDVSIEVSWLDGAQGRSYLSGSIPSYLPTLLDVRLRMDDIIQFWRAVKDGHPVRLLQHVNLSSGAENTFIGRGRSIFRLVTKQVWEDPESKVDFLHFIDEPDVLIERRLWQPGTPYVQSRLDWQARCRTSGRWNWRVMVDGTEEGQRIPDVKVGGQLVAGQEDQIGQPSFRSSIWNAEMKMASPRPN